MPIFRKVAKKLGLKDVGKATLFATICDNCGEELRSGRDQFGQTHIYCPKCKKIIATVKIPRFSPPQKFPPHDD